MATDWITENVIYVYALNHKTTKIKEKRVVVANIKVSVGIVKERNGWRILTKKWMAYINKESIREYLGKFKIEDDAARAYNEAAKRYYGEYAKLNIL